jgi:hypothetical protein
VVLTPDNFMDGIEPLLTGAWTVILSVGEPGSDGRVITTYVCKQLAYLGDIGDLGDEVILDSTGRVRLSDSAFGGSLVLGSVAAFGATGGGGGFTLSPGLWLKTNPAGIDTGLGGMGGGGLPA